MGIVNTDKYDYIMTYSFPCTDLSKAGKQQGMSRESGTRSGLLWEVERLLKEVEHLPQFLLMENVPDVLSEKFIKDFADWVAFLDSLGYTSKWAIINAKEQGIPQNRERCFMLSWLEKDCYYLFPQPKKLTKRLKDVLETEVDEKYYLSDKIVNYFTKHSEDMKAKGNGFRFSPIERENADTAKAITTRSGSRMDDNFISEPTLQQVAQIQGTYESSNRVYSPYGLCPTINTMQGGGLEPKIVEPIIVDDTYGFENEPREYTETCPTLRSERQGLKVAEPICLNSKVDGKQPSLNDRVYDIDGVFTTIATSPFFTCSIAEPTIWGSQQEHCAKNTDGICPTLTSAMGMGGGQIPLHNYDYRIRKLTPLECWRLMDFDDEDYEKASKICSRSQLYKQAGNSIVVACLVEIFRPLLSKEC